jgi:hypothetical protein
LSVQWALHLRDPLDAVELDRSPGEILAVADEQSYLLDGKPIEGCPSSFERIYVGDEFCPHRMPSPAELEAFFGMAVRNGRELTLLTPVLTDEELEKCGPLFDCLAALDPQSEVVVNDWGVLSCLQKKYPLLRIAAGRVLNKGFKDPRFEFLDGRSSLTDGMREVLNQSTFDRMDFQHLLRQQGISRMERDMLPYGERIPGSPLGFGTSVYFPFGYVTSGRVCWTASFEQSPSQRFIPGKECTRPCRRVSFELTGIGCSFRVLQNGNTVFYLYTPPMLKTLWCQAKDDGFRLVYQGLAF